MKTHYFFIFFLNAVFQLFSQEDYGTGLLVSQDKYNQIELTAPIVTRSFTRLPNSYSLKPYCPTPKSQGKQGSCVGWASAYGARTIANAIKNNWQYNITKINQNTFSPAFVYNQIKVNNQCQGAYIEDAMKLLNNYGTTQFYDFPYNENSCLQRPSQYAVSKAKPNKILRFERLVKWDTPHNLIGKVKKAISEKNPVVFGLFKFNSLLTLNKQHIWIPNYGNKGHAMVVVGYNDNYAGGAFEIMNSWGTGYGNNGFFWITYNDFKRFTKTAYVLIDTPKSQHISTHNTLSGTLTLQLSNGSKMPVTLDHNANRGFNIVKASNTTYRVTQSYSSGTQFRIYLKNKQRGYIYLIGYGGADKSVNQLYPFDGYSDFFNYSDSEIAIPNEDYFIEFDQKPGNDILCVLFSKERLNIAEITRKAQYEQGDFVTRIKKTVATKMVSGKNVQFSSNKIAFSTQNAPSSATVVPIFIEINHQ